MPLDVATRRELDELIADLRDRELSDPQSARLAEILKGDREARLEYLRRIDQCASIRRYSADLSFTHDPAEAGAASMLTEALMRQRLGADDEASDLGALPEVIVAEPVPTTVGHRARRGGPLGGWVAQRMLLVAMAAALVALALPTMRFLTEAIDTLDRPEGSSEPATLTAVDAAQWDATGPAVMVGRSVGAGTLRLVSGRAELTFGSGAVVSLVGPCSFAVDDGMHGRLIQGRVEAEVPAVASGFTIAGPGFAIIDRGTAFTVEIPPRGKPWVHVTEGAVDLAMTNEDGSIRRSMRLTEDLSATVDPIARRVTVSEPVAIDVHSTGAGLDGRSVDPHWRVTQRVYAPDDPDAPAPSELEAFASGPAYAGEHYAAWVRRTAEHAARWVTVTPDNASQPGSTVHTFETSFNLTGLDPETAKLRLRFIADNYVKELRVNGLAVDVPAHGDDAPFKTFTEMTLRHVFVEGVNTLEFDVRNIWPLDRPSPTGLLVEITGVAHRSTRIDIRNGDDE